jgi:hypothetical protein
MRYIDAARLAGSEAVSLVAWGMPPPAEERMGRPYCKAVMAPEEMHGIDTLSTPAAGFTAAQVPALKRCRRLAA